MIKPNFFIIGAPKCGTTSLAAWLAEHPQIYMCPGKEPHFFNRDGAYWIETLAKYESLFAYANSQHLAVGEASTRYLYSRVAVPQIIEYNPDAKFIVCIRNPIDMVLSLHSEMVWRGQETVRDFERAWQLQAERKSGRHIPLTIRRDPERVQYGAYCRLGEQLARLYTLIVRERVLVLVLEDLAKDPAEEYRKTLGFLNVDESFQTEFAVWNQRKAVRWPLMSLVLSYLNQLRWHLGFRMRLNIYDKVQRAINKADAEQTRISPDLRNELVAYFSDDIHLLEHLLGRDFSYWLTPK